MSRYRSDQIRLEKIRSEEIQIRELDLQTRETKSELKPKRRMETAIWTKRNSEMEDPFRPFGRNQTSKWPFQSIFIYYYIKHFHRIQQAKSARGKAIWMFPVKRTRKT